MRQQEILLYIHIPFCVKKCAYCDFLSFPADGPLQRSYLEALRLEIRDFCHRLDEQKETYRLRSVFFGGGTPSILPADWIAEILREIRACCGESLQIENSPEITLEANPGTLDVEKLETYRRAGVNRLSIGCQSASDRELRELGRIHTFAAFRETFHLARETGFSNINADLMFGIPGQTEKSWENTLRTVADLGPEHVSAYSLILEEGTPLNLRYPENKRGERLPADPAFPPLPGEETEREMYHRTEEILREYGFRRYEISNYAKPGWESRHNIGYWDGTLYRGFGLGAASLLGWKSLYGTHLEKQIPAGQSVADAEEVRVRFSNTRNLKQYLKNPSGSAQLEEWLTRKKQMAEAMMLGFRMIRGISREEFRRRFGTLPEEVYGPQLRRQMQEGLVQEVDERYCLTARGLDLANLVMEDYI